MSDPLLLIVSLYRLLFGLLVATKILILELILNFFYQVLFSALIFNSLGTHKILPSNYFLTNKGYVL